MEVQVLNVDQAPPGSVLSIKAGSTRRQAPLSAALDSGATFIFAATDRAGDGPVGGAPDSRSGGACVAPPANIGIELLRSLGERRLALRPGEGTYAVPLGPGGEYKVRFAVRKPTCKATKRADEEDAEEGGRCLLGAPGQAGTSMCARNDRAPELLPGEQHPGAVYWDPNAAPVSPSKRGKLPLHPSTRKSETVCSKEYLEEKGVLSLMKGLLETIVKEQPDDPFTFIADQLTHGLQDAVSENARALEEEGDRCSSRVGEPAEHASPLPLAQPPKQEQPLFTTVPKMDLPSIGTWLLRLPLRAPPRRPAAPSCAPAVVPFKLLPSTGTWLHSKPLRAPPRRPAAPSCAPAVVPFKLLPSTGTWLHSKPLRAPPRRPAAPSCAPAVVPFKLLPSTGTWLHSKPPLGVPPLAPALFVPLNMNAAASGAVHFEEQQLRAPSSMDAVASKTVPFEEADRSESESAASGVDEATGPCVVPTINIEDTSEQSTSPKRGMGFVSTLLKSPRALGTAVVTTSARGAAAVAAQRPVSPGSTIAGAAQSGMTAIQNSPRAIAAGISVGRAGASAVGSSAVDVAHSGSSAVASAASATGHAASVVAQKGVAKVVAAGTFAGAIAGSVAFLGTNVPQRSVAGAAGAAKEHLTSLMKSPRALISGRADANQPSPRAAGAGESVDVSSTTGCGCVASGDVAGATEGVAVGTGSVGTCVSNDAAAARPGSSIVAGVAGAAGAAMSHLPAFMKSPRGDAAKAADASHRSPHRTDAGNSAVVGSGECPQIVACSTDSAQPVVSNGAASIVSALVPKGLHVAKLQFRSRSNSPAVSPQASPRQ